MASVQVGVSCFSFPPPAAFTFYSFTVVQVKAGARVTWPRGANRQQSFRSLQVQVITQKPYVYTVASAALPLVTKL